MLYEVITNLMSTVQTNVQADFFIGQPNFVDLDQDGDLDLYLSGQYNIKIYKNDGANNFVESGLVNSNIGSYNFV